MVHYEKSLCSTCLNISEGIKNLTEIHRVNRMRKIKLTILHYCKIKNTTQKGEALGSCLN